MSTLNRIILSLMLLMGIIAFGKKNSFTFVTAGKTLNNAIAGKSLNLDKGNGEKMQFTS